MNEHYMRKHIIDPNRLAEILGAELNVSKNNKAAKIIHKNGLSVILDYSKPQNLEIVKGKDSLSISNLTDVYYFKNNRVFIAEKVTNGDMFEIAIFGDGRFEFRARNLDEIKKSSTLTSLYGYKNKHNALIEKVSKEKVIQPFVEIVKDKKNTLQKELIKLFRNILTKYPSKPEMRDKNADDYISLLNILVGDFNKLMKLKVNINQNFSLEDYINDTRDPVAIYRIKNEIVNYLTWYKEKSHDQKGLLQALNEYEMDGKISIFSVISPKTFNTSCEITIEELSDKLVAFYCFSREYNHKKKIYSMVIEPDYGYTEELRNKRFRISFTDCLHVSERDNILDANEPPLGLGEFNEWGIESVGWKKNLEKSKFAELRKLKMSDLKDYKMFFLGGVADKEIIIICKDSMVEEVEKNKESVQ